MNKCKNGYDPLFPNQAPSELNPCVNNTPPYDTYIPEAAMGDYTVPVLEEEGFELPDVFIGNGPDKKKKVNTNKIGDIAKKVGIVLMGLMILAGLGLGLKKLAFNNG